MHWLDNAVVTMESYSGVCLQGLGGVPVIDNNSTTQAFVFSGGVMIMYKLKKAINKTILSFVSVILFFFS